MNLLEQAKMYATRKHVLENHDLYGEIVPYTHHLAAVEVVAARFGFTDEVMRAAAWLHDIIEDTRGKPNEVRRRNIEELFGDEVEALVWAVTSEEGQNRKVRNALTYPKIRETGPRAVALKLSDRIANVENGGRAVAMYRKEHPEFKHGVYIPAPVAVISGQVTPEFNDQARVYDMQRHLDWLLESL